MKTPIVKFIFDRKKQATNSTAKAPKKGLIQLEISYNRKRRYLTTGIKVYANQWNERTSSVINSVNMVDYNALLAGQLAAVIEQIKEQTMSGIFNIETIEIGRNTSEMKFVDYMHECISKYELSGISQSSVRIYQGMANVIETFPKWGTLQSFSSTLLDQFDQELIRRGKKPKTRRNYLTLIKHILKSAYQDKLIAENPIEDYSMPRVEGGKRKYLTEEQLKAIVDAGIKPNCQAARDLFLFQCYTGLSYADTQSLTNDMIVQENDKWYIARTRVKTKVLYRITLLPPAIEIIQKYNNNTPKILLDKYTYNLNAIAKRAGLNLHLSSHMGRHTFATWALKHGVPIEIVSKMLGHTDIKTTQIYAKILAQDVDEQFDRLSELFK